MIVTCAQMREAEELAFSRGRSAGLLMEVAGNGIGKSLARFFPDPGSLVIFLGKGNNGGDALVAAKLLAEDGWGIFVRLTAPVGELAELPTHHLEDLDMMGSLEILEDDEDLGHLDPPLVLLDGLVGIGAKGALRGEIAIAAEEINSVRKSLGAAVVAVDIPSGIDGDSGEPCPGAVVADITMTVSAAKAGLLADSATNHAGRIVLIAVPEIPVSEVGGEIDRVLITPRGFRNVLSPRKFEMHKGDAGRVAVVAGSTEFSGAAVLASSAAVRGGAGLVTLYLPGDCHELIASKSVPEVMVKSVGSYRDILDADADAIVLGPGLGEKWPKEILELILSDPRPMVVDADGLNILAKAGVEKLSKAVGPRLLTPHPGEMARLLRLGTPSELGDRAEAVRKFVDRFPGVTLLLKGARTVVGEKGRPLAFNTTGNPGMATGGCGDVLAGLCAALMGQGLSPYEAGCIGSWVNGRAGEIAVWEGEESEESLAAGDLVKRFGKAFGDCRSG